MPPKKKSKKSTTPKAKKKPVVEPLEHLSEVRDRAVKVLIKSEKNKNVNYDIEQNIREIRAILATNTEIFDRCMEYFKEGEYHGTHSNNQYTFVRVNFNTINSIPQDREDNDTVAQLVAIPSRTESEFDMSSLIDPPIGIDDIIVIKRISGSYDNEKFIDYRKFFESALLLHDDVLEPILAKLKDKLMDIQVCLGNIDAWVMEPQQCINFLKDTFKESSISIESSVKKYGERPNCTCDTPDIEFNSDYELIAYCNSCGTEDNVHNLKEFENVHSKYEATFDIREEKEQKRLIKLLELLDMEEAENKAS